MNTSQMQHYACITNKYLIHTKQLIHVIYKTDTKQPIQDPHIQFRVLVMNVCPGPL